MDGILQNVCASWDHKSNVILCMLEAWKQNAKAANYEAELQDHAWLLVLMHVFYVCSLGQRELFCQCALLQFQLRGLSCRTGPASCTRYNKRWDSVWKMPVFISAFRFPSPTSEWSTSRVAECFSPPAFHGHKHTHTPASLIYNDLSLKCSRPTIYLQLLIWQIG